MIIAISKMRTVNLLQLREIFSTSKKHIIVRFYARDVKVSRTLKPSRDDFNVLHKNGKHDRCI